MPDLAVAPGVRSGDVDTVLVNVQTDVQSSARFCPWPVSMQVRNDPTGYRSGALV
jgi:hypothetical protein